ncbi:AAA family ATPase [Fusobacterium sp.]|uniref:AAA family ATPase n=1 Tax=Fusobacterium sp. TaxID=68766 RepID=UPI002624F02B|nr:AAA family ATPase [Fusobacterium sp.]
MRLKKLKIEKYKNLRDIEINFSSNYSIFIGENGGGKTNILEAISKIFSDLYSNKLGNSFKENYEMEYEIKNKIVNLKFTKENNKLESKVDSENIKKDDLKDYLPEHIILLYSGKDKKLEEIYKKMTKNYIDNNLYKLEKVPLRKMLYLTPEYNKILFLNYLKENEEKKIIANNIEIILKIPTTWGKNKPTKAQGINGIFKNAKGELKALLEKWGEKVSYEEGKFFFVNNNSNINNNFLKDDDLIDFKTLDLFLLSDIIQDIKIEVRGNIEFDNFSEGQKQKYMNLALINLFPEKEVLILLDEPDSHLHPKWIREYGTQLNEILEVNKKQHLLYVTHSPLILGTTNDENIYILKNGKVSECNSETFCNDVNTILSEVMNVKKYTTDIMKHEEIILEALIDNKLFEAKSELEMLKNNLRKKGVKNLEDHDLVLELSGMIRRMELMNELTK